MLGIGQGASGANRRSSPLPRSSSDILLQHLSELLLQKVNFILQKKTELTASLPYLFSLSGLLAYCIFGVENSMLRRWDRLRAIAYIVAFIFACPVLTHYSLNRKLFSDM